MVKVVAYKLYYVTYDTHTYIHNVITLHRLVYYINLRSLYSVLYYYTWTQRYDTDRIHMV